MWHGDTIERAACWVPSKQCDLGPEVPKRRSFTNKNYTIPNTLDTINSVATFLGGGPLQSTKERGPNMPPNNA